MPQAILVDKLAKIRHELGIEQGTAPQTIKAANEMLQLEPGRKSLIEQADAILAEIGVAEELEEIVVAQAVVIDTTSNMPTIEMVAAAVPVVIGTAAPPPRGLPSIARQASDGGSGSSILRQLSARLPRMGASRYKRSETLLPFLPLVFAQLLLTAASANLVLQELYQNGALDEHFPTPSPPPPPAPPAIPTQCPFDHWECNHGCALQLERCLSRADAHTNERQRSEARSVCRDRHGPDLPAVDAGDHWRNSTLANASLYARFGVEHVGNGVCERAGCGTFCACQYDGGDCPLPATPRDDSWIYLLLFAAWLFYFWVWFLKMSGSMLQVLSSPRLNTLAQVTEYVKRIQAAKPTVKVKVVCSHSETRGSGKNRKRVTVVTFRSSATVPIGKVDDHTSLVMQVPTPAHLPTAPLHLIACGLHLIAC